MSDMHPVSAGKGILYSRADSELYRVHELKAPVAFGSLLNCGALDTGYTSESAGGAAGCPGAMRPTRLLLGTGHGTCGDFLLMVRAKQMASRLEEAHHRGLGSWMTCIGVGGGRLAMAGHQGLLIVLTQLSRTGRCMAEHPGAPENRKQLMLAAGCTETPR